MARRVEKQNELKRPLLWCCRAVPRRLLRTEGMGWMWLGLSAGVPRVLVG